MAHCYILYSNSLDRFYTGSTDLEPAQRLNLHLSKYYGIQKYTAAASDWVLYLVLSCQSIEAARAIERHIKNMKSKKYIQNLQRYAEMRNRLLEKYNNPGSPR